MKQRLQANDRD
jgi:magnesium-transporting ATPase (P-type)